MQNASLLCLLWINSLLYLQTGGAKCASSIISSLGAMADPQLLHTVVPWLMLLLLWLLSPGEDLSHNPHHDIILKHNHACYCQYSHWVALCQRAAVLILSLYFSESFSFTVWWNAKPPPSMSLPVVKQRCPVCPLKFWLSGGCFIIYISPWNCCQLSLLNQLFVWCQFWNYTKLLSMKKVVIKINTSPKKVVLELLKIKLQIYNYFSNCLLFVSLFSTNFRALWYFVTMRILAH